MGDVGEPDGGSVGEEGSDGGSVGIDEGLLLLTPLDARHCFEDRYPLLGSVDDAVDVGAEGQGRVEGHPKDFGALLEWEGGVVEGNGGVGVQLTSIRAEEGDGGFLGGDLQSSSRRPLLHLRCLSGQGRSGLRGGLGRGRDSEVVGVGGGEGVGGLRELGDIEVEQEGGDHRALGDACVDGVGFGSGVVVPTDSCTTPEVRGQPSDGVVLHVGVVYVGEKCCVVHRVEGFGEIHCHGHGAAYGVVVVETFCYLVDQWEKSCDSGAAGAETVLRIREVDMGSDFGVEKFL